MLGSIIGDIIGSTYEFRNAKSYDFDPFPPGSDFTDDTVLTVAIADAILNNRDYSDLGVRVLIRHLPLKIPEYQGFIV
jgi:ADP-ribosylglycohydrolase